MAYRYDVIILDVGKSTSAERKKIVVDTFTSYIMPLVRTILSPCGLCAADRTWREPKLAHSRVALSCRQSPLYHVYFCS